MTRAITLGLAALLTLAGPLTAQDAASARTVPTVTIPSAAWDAAVEAFANQLTEHVATDDVGGIAAGIVLNGDLVWARGFGWSDRHNRTPMPPGAVSRTGSISKTVTAMVLMRLVDRGIVALDDPVERYLPDALGRLVFRRKAAPSAWMRAKAECLQRGSDSPDFPAGP